jgi:hypothetical protein
MRPPKSGRTGAGIAAYAATSLIRATSLVRRITTMAELAGNPGFTAPKLEETLSRRHAVAIELIATLALTVSLVVAATAVSMGNRALTRGDLVERPAVQMPIARE